MAAITLPNTYTEYVPLDTLLAEQLNNDNENNQYIANNTLPLPLATTQTMTTSQNVGTSETQLLSISVTAGTYLAIATGALLNNTVSAGDCSLSIKSGSTVYGVSYASLGVTDYYASLTCIGTVTVNAATTINLVAKAGVNSVTVPANNRTQLTVVRIA